MTLTNTKADFERLVAVLSGYGLPVRIGFEATGNYHRALAHHLSCAGFELKLVSSVALARTREALHNSWDKNDPKDAQVILHMLQIGAVQVFHDPLLAGVNDIQELSKTHEIVSRAKTELWHRILTHYLPLYFPEADRYHRSSRTDWFLAFLEAFPSPHFIAAMSKEAFIAAAWTVVGRRVSKTELLSDIYETAKTSVGLPVDPDSDAIAMFRMVLAEGRSLTRQRNEIEARSIELLSGLTDYRLLTSIPGIGPIKRPYCVASATSSAVSDASSACPFGAFLCVERCCPSTRHASRSDTSNFGNPPARAVCSGWGWTCYLSLWAVIRTDLKSRGWRSSTRVGDGVGARRRSTGSSRRASRAGGWFRRRPGRTGSRDRC